MWCSNLYKCFISQKVIKGFVIRDSGLALCVLGLIVIDLFILTTYTATEEAKGELGVERISNRENPQDIIGVRQIMLDTQSS